MLAFDRPQIITSKCLNIAPCRWDGSRIKNRLLECILGYADIIPVCPEEEIGLGTPRTPIRLVEKESEIYLQEYETGKDFTDSMRIFTSQFISSKTRNIDGAILKNRSPSCGIGDVKVYPSAKKCMAHSKSSGIFGGKLQESFPHWAIEDEGRLHDKDIRYHFLAQLFANAALRNRDKSHLSNLIHFHTQYKYLYMALSPTLLKKMGNILANHHHLEYTAVIQQYTCVFEDIWKKPMKRSSHINVLQHCFGYVSGQCTSRQRKYFLSVLEKYKSYKIPLIVPLSLLKNWAYEYNNEYLLQQYYLEPFPEELQYV